MEVQQPKCLPRVPAQALLCIHSTWTRCVPSSLPEPSSFRPQPISTRAGRTSAPSSAGEADVPPQPEPPTLALECGWSQRVATACGKTAGSIKHCQVKRGVLGGLSEWSPMYYYNIYLKKPTLSVSSRQHLIKCVGLPGAPSSC